MARKDIAMSDAEIAAYLASHHTLQLATIGRDGWPHLSTMWYVVDDGHVVFRSFTKSQKIVNLPRDPRLTVLVESGDAYAELKGVMIRGTARLVDDRDFELKIYGKLAAGSPMAADGGHGGSGGELSDDALEAAFGRHAEKNTAVVVEPESIVSWDHTKLSGAY